MPEAAEYIKIRRAVRNDLADLVVLEQECFAVPWSEEALRHDLEEHPEAVYFVAAEPGGRVIGYAAYWQIPGEAMITNLSVLPAWRRRHIGRRLLQTVIEHAVAEQLPILTLEVRPSNQAARLLYESAGFIPVGVRRGYYADNGEDAIIMQKIIA